MGVSNGELVQGTLEMLVLKTLALESMHGYGIALRIEQVSERCVPGEPGVTASRTEPHGAGWANSRGMALDGKQSPGEILHADCRRA